MALREMTISTSGYRKGDIVDIEMASHLWPWSVPVTSGVAFDAETAATDGSTNVQAGLASGAAQ
jgi:hypothetical protein